MRLEFPHVRLFLADRLMAGDGDCVDVMLEGAYNFGVLDDGALSGASFANAGGVCKSLSAARKILEHYVSADGSFGDKREQDRLTERIWKDLLRDLETYRSVENIDHCCDGESGEASECDQLAPVVFDLMLQQIRRNL